MPASHLPRPITMIVNTHSRRGRMHFDEAVEAVRNAGIPIAEAHAVGDKAETAALIQREVEAGAATIIVGGGDGTLSGCASQLVHTSVAMGVLPMGTGNTLVRSLGIPLSLEAAAKTIAEGHVETVDVGRVNGRVFLNSVTLGLSSEIAHALDADTKRRLGLLAWPVIGTKVFLRHRPFMLRVTSPEHTLTARTHQFVVANGRYIAGPIAAAPDASIQNKALDVFVLGGADKRSFLIAALRWLQGEHVHFEKQRYMRTTNVRVESLRRPIPADVDGEINERTPLDIEIEADALRIIVPRGFDAENA